MKITKHQAQGFLDSLFPCGDMAYLATHTRSFFEGMLGEVPQFLRHAMHPSDVERDRAFADSLRQIADHIEKGNVPENLGNPDDAQERGA